MLAIVLFGLALLFAIVHLSVKKLWHSGRVAEHFLAYILFFNLGVEGLLAAYAHVFMGPETAAQIGWKGGSPFQYEIGMANLAFGVLGIMSFWIRDNFWTATVIGWAILFLGCFVGHVIDYYATGNTAPYNIGIFIWIADLFLPLFGLFLLRLSRQ